MSRSFNSPSRSPGNSRLQHVGAVSQRQRSTAVKKTPEPLRRAVADCLSSASSLLLPSSHHGNPSVAASEAARKLRDYLAAPSTTDMAYSVLLEHALAERDRSPGVVARCVAVLKQYLLRYVPKEQTLQQIDSFCVNCIAECATVTNRTASTSLKSVGQHSALSVTSGTVRPPSSPVASFASGALVKSLNYVRSLVARHMPKRPFQPAAFAGASTASRQSLPTLSSLLRRSFNYQLGPGPLNARESPERREFSGLSALNSPSSERADVDEGIKYIAIDVLKWRWSGDREQQSSSVTTKSDGVRSAQELHIHSFLEVGAAALLVGDMEPKMKGKPQKYPYTRDISDLDPLLQPSTIVTATNFASAPSHLRAITASKRMKPGAHQVWEDVPVNTFRPRAHPLFQYRHYSEQQPLRLNPGEVYEVIAAVCSETSSPNANLMTMSSRLTNRSGKPSMDVAVSVLIKLVIDMYVLDSRTAAPLTLFMLEEMLKSPRLASRLRAFDLILNVGVHAQLLEPMLPEYTPTIEEEEESSQESYPTNEAENETIAKENIEPDKKDKRSSAIDNFESWLLGILYEILLLLVQVIKVLLEISREHSWAAAVRSKLICMLTNMCYQVPNESMDPDPNIPIFVVEQVDLLGGIEFICLEYSQANLREEKRNLFLVLFDYVLHQINEAYVAAGASAYSYEDIQPLATMLTLADAPEAFYIAVKHGVEGIGEILRRSISESLSRYPNFERLNTLLEKITRRLDSTISMFTHLDEEFSYMIRITKSYKSLERIEHGLEEVDVGMKIKLSWATLHSLLHSERSSYRHNGYIWLVELLVSEISEGDTSIWLNISNLRKQIGIAGNQDSSMDSSVPLPICILCGLLKSKHNFIRWGFLFVLEKLLMRLKLLLDENELQQKGSGEVVSSGQRGNCLDEANAVIDIMSSALSLVVQINETDRINILKMCDMLLSQLCLRVSPATGVCLGDLTFLGNLFGCTNESGRADGGPRVLQQVKSHGRDELLGDIGSSSQPDHPPLICKTTSMAALLLRGYAFVPMQLVERVPTALFYWPLIQLAGAATDDIALGVAVGSKGRGNLPGATSDIRAALLLLLIGKCSDPAAFQEVDGEEFFRELLDDTDSRVAYYSSAFLLKRMMTEEPEKYQRMLQSLIFKAQQSNNEKLLENPYLQMRGILQLSNDLGNQL
ncbi:uncharacterized protein LOC131252965 isoform X2 [Magnolia sinica]|uniref:uncharacterized protein LOC131252965 isoform X2 n=1 Tax=Magnolia sinica TaxID=86752 RepID=UPI0026586AC4|nr:uncharacterized protein LOC131252965 isoform X2 [Magnolia sinica]